MYNPHRANKRIRTKEKSTSFFLSESFLNILQEVATYENVSKSAIVERALVFERLKNKGGTHEQCFQKSIRAYKGSYRYKKAQKVFGNQIIKQTNKNTSQAKEFEQKSIFDYVCG